jgi:hypothetical protein
VQPGQQQEKTRHQAGFFSQAWLLVSAAGAAEDQAVQ